MEFFFETEKTIEKGHGFKNFDTEHLLWLAATVVIILIFTLHYRKLKPESRGKWRKTVAVLLVLDEVFKQACLLIGGNFHPSFLPLHLCNANIFLIAIHAWRPHKTIGNFLYVICIPAAIAAMAFPAWDKLPWLNFMYLHSFTVHILLLLYPIALTAGGDIRPEAKQIPKVLVLLAVLAVVEQCFNLLWDTNFFYLMRSGGKNNPLYWFEKNWGDHFYGLPILVAGAMIVMYAPVELGRKLKMK